MNNIDETLYNSNEQQLPPIPQVPATPEALEKSNKSAAGIAAAVAGSMAVGGLGAWGLYEYLNHQSAEISGDDVANVADSVHDADLNAPEPVIAQNEVHVHHVVQPAEEPAQRIEYVQLVETEVNGQKVIVGMQYDAHGHRVMLIDADHDGQFDLRAIDVNDDGNFAQVVDLHENGEAPMMVADFQHQLEVNGIEPIYAYRPGDNGDNTIDENPSVELAEMHHIQGEDGSEMNVALVRVGNKDVYLLDADNDGNFEHIASDMNENGRVDDGEFDRLDETMSIAEVRSLPHADGYQEDPSLAYTGYDNDEAVVDGEPVDSLDGDVADGDYNNHGYNADEGDAIDVALVPDENNDVEIVDTLDDDVEITDNTDADTGSWPEDEQPADSWPEDEQPADSWPEEENPADSGSDDFGTMGDEGIIC